MQQFFPVLALLLICAGCDSPQNKTGSTVTPADQVDVFIGTGGHGHTYPGATVPFGMVQLSPDNGKGGWDYSSGYHYPDSTIAGFSMTHLSGTGIGDLYDISFMPFNGASTDTSAGAVYATFSHNNESASPGFYHVAMDNDIGVDLTASKRVGFYRYKFDKKTKPAISLNLGFSINYDSTTASKMHMVNDTLITGYRMSTGWAHKQRVYFAAAFSEPISRFEGTQDGKMMAHTQTLQGRTAHGYFFFSKGDSLLQKVGISAVSAENARKNLQEEIRGWNFKKVHQAARKAWNTELSKIAVQSGDKAKRTTFYTALYHTMLGPTLYMDVNDQYRGADDKVHTAKNFTNYSTFSLWDTYRAEHPLLTFVEPNRVNDIIKFMLAFYDEHGLLPVWELAANETNTMIGYHAIPVITDAYLKGFRDFDVQKAYEAMKKSANQQNNAVKLFNKVGYVPSDKVNESVSKTLAYAYDDWCIAQMAKALGKSKDYQTYSKRAGYYKNVFNPESGFMHPQMANGQWEKPFDPLVEPRDFSKRDYTEANAWQILWYVPQDMPRFIDLMGGKMKFENRLDSLFTMSSKMKGEVPDMSGTIGQYVQGNEPDQQVPYLYDYVGASWKTQHWVHIIADSLYHNGPGGLPGNEDVGQMSAWYVFSALGFYPVNPANGVYAIGRPAFPKAVIHVKDGKTFTVKAKGASDENMYIQSARLNGKLYYKPYITYRQIMDGGTLSFVMGSQPNKKWGAGRENRPPLTAFGSASGR